MRRLFAGITITVVVASCTSITGAGDLSSDPSSPSSSGARSSGDPSSSSSGSASGAVEGGSSGATSSGGTSSSSSSSTGGASDASLDANDAAAPPIPLEDVTYQCVPLAADQSSGLLLDSTVWPGFRFEVTGTKAVTTTSIGVHASVTTPGKIFGAIVKLTSATDSPDANNLSSSDVLKTTVIDLTSTVGISTAKLHSAPIAVTLAPGFYAAVFGSGGAFGSTASAATIPAQSGAGGCTNGLGYPFSITQSPSGSLILQATTPHMILRGTRPE